MKPNQVVKKVLTAPLLTTIEAAEIIGVRAQTLAVWRSQKRYPDLPFIKVGGAVRYRLADLETWLASRTVGQGSSGDST
jgi:hypothetical protein